MMTAHIPVDKDLTRHTNCTVNLIPGGGRGEAMGGEGHSAGEIGAERKRKKGGGGGEQTFPASPFIPLLA